MAAAGALALAAVRVVLALRVDRLTALPDEVGFLGDAWLIGRGQPAPPMGFAPFYPPGQPLLLGPVAAVTEGAEVLATSARLVDVVLLAAMVPVLIALLGRLGRLDPGPRALAAVTASALPGLWIAAVVVWPDALAALLWPLALLALAALAGRGPLLARVWFGPAVAALWVVHARFLPVVILGGALLVLRLVAPRPRSGSSGGPLGERTADAVNLVLGGLVLVGGLWLSHVVEVRWTTVAPGPLSGATDDLAATARGSLRSLAGQGWYALAGTAGLAGIGVVTLVRAALTAGRDRLAPWHDPVRLVAAGAVLGWAAVVVATSVQLRSPFAFGAEPVLDLVANGRYQEVVLAPLVAVGAARLLRGTVAVADRIGLVVTAIALAAVVMVLVGFSPSVLNGASAAGVTWATSAWSAVPVVIPTALVVVVMGVVQLGRTGRRTALVVVVVLLVGATLVGAERAEEVVAASREPSTISPELPRLDDRVAGQPAAYLSDGATLALLTTVSWDLADSGMTVFARGETPPEALVVTRAPTLTGPTPSDPGLPPEARLSAVLGESGLALWVLPGAQAERLAAAGLLYPEDPTGAVPESARRASVRTPAEVATAGTGAAPVPVEVTHDGGGAVWPAGAQTVDLVLRGPAGAVLSVPVGELDPGATTTVAVPGLGLASAFGPGRHDLTVEVVQRGVPFALDGPAPTLRVEVG